MTEFMHSEVLFAGDDGLPLQFNIQSTVEKNLKVIIEHGGGICTLCDDAIYLISPGTKVVNVPSNKQLISTRYIFDSVKEDCLMDFEDYQVQIHEMNISDFSESSASNLPENQVNFNNCGTLGNVMKDGSASPPNLLNCSKSNHAFDFLDSQSHNNATGFNMNNEPRDSHVIFPLQTSETDIQLGLPDNQIDQSFDDVTNEGSDGNVSSPDLIKCSNKSVLEFEDNKTHNDVPSFSTKNEQGCSHVVIPLQTAETHIQFSSLLKQKINPNTCVNAIPDSLEDGEQAINVRDNSPAEEQLNIEANPVDPVFIDDEPAIAVVSSSQENEGGLDQFDKMILNKVQEKPSLENENPLSQSDTVSSSADAQVSPKQPSLHTSAEIFNESVPDSASETAERQAYINILQKEIEAILRKPSPKSITDKIALVKYICVVKKLPPAIVLQALQSNS